MRLKSFLALAAAVVSLGLAAAPQPASANFWDRPDQPAGWGTVRTVRHWVYYPRYHHVYLGHGVSDPYAYRYSPRGYYPYYNSAYWGAPRVHRYRGHLPPYYAAWGAPSANYHHVEWHQRHYGGHRRGDW
jgi:hypothetical protein